ncbi:MAG: ThiF family adenylyltransferase, partial [Treponema sp.]|nr:ThiF family adenylyltransferase [Treponema sp.]
MLLSSSKYVTSNFTLPGIPCSPSGEILVNFNSDTVSVSNINRQIIATHSSVGKLKVEVAKARIL